MKEKKSGDHSGFRIKKGETDHYPALSKKMLKKDVEGYAGAIGKNGVEYLKWSLHPEEEVANRASWIFRTWADKHSDQLPGLFQELYDTIAASDNGSVIRNLTGVWVDHAYPSRYDGKITALGIQLLNTSDYAIAVYANVLGFLKFPCSRYPELKEEIRLISQRHPLAGENGFIKRLQDVMNA